MKKTILLISLVVCCLILYWGWLITIPNVTYTKDDLFKYYALTHKEIRDAPRVSKSYFFEYGPSDESTPQSSMICFCELSDIDEAYKKLMAYIVSSGVMLRKGYTLNDEVKYEKYFELFETSVNAKPCLVLSYSVESH